MIVRWGFRIVGPARAFYRQSFSTAASETCHRAGTAWRQRPRAPPERASRRDLARRFVTERQAASVTHGDTGPRNGAGPAEAPLAQANQAPPESTTERS
jgi:hypothetical protein